MKWLLRLVLYGLGRRAKRGALHEAKRRSLLVYLRVVDGTRRAMVLALLAFFALQIMTLAFAGAVATGVFLIDADLDFRLRVLFCVCLALFLIPALALTAFFSSRAWLKLSGAAKMVEDLNRP